MQASGRGIIGAMRPARHLLHFAALGALLERDDAVVSERLVSNMRFALGSDAAPERLYREALALGGFNVGIEVGQLALVAALLALAALARRLADVSSARSLRWAALAPAYAIGSLGTYWCLDRIAVAF